MIRPDTPVGGSSAGSIVAAALACGVAEAEVVRALELLVVDVRGGMQLNTALRIQLDSLLDDSSVEAAQEHGLRLCYLQVLPWPKGHVVSKWADKEDLIGCICASCNW